MPNPVLNDKTFQKAEAQAGWAAPTTDAAGGPIGPITDGPVSPYVGYRPEGEVMTRSGAYTATGVLLAILLMAGAVGWFTVSESTQGDVVDFPAWLLLPLLAAVGVGIWAALKPPLARILGPIYAILQGLVLGAISHVYESQWSGIVLLAIGVTGAVTVVMYLLYATQIIKVTNRFRKIVIGATFGVMIFYGLSLILSLFGVDVSYFSSTSGWSIALSVVIAGIAAFNLALDFDLIDRGSAAGAPKFMEWYAAFGLMVTIVWLYLEVLRLLSKIQSR
jgi:uncharacterized YccA/Bax inhibitor family protein